jgi:hypothetical protein
MKMGYKDYKHLLYADKSSGPLSLLVPAAKAGPVSHYAFKVEVDAQLILTWWRKGDKAF